MIASVHSKNGVPILTGQTAADGRVTFPSLGKPTREKKPVAFVARRGNDVAFMPYAREDRQLDYSRFDTGGVESRSGAELDAFVFTERGTSFGSISRFSSSPTAATRCYSRTSADRAAMARRSRRPGLANGARRWKTTSPTA